MLSRSSYIKLIIEQIKFTFEIYKVFTYKECMDSMLTDKTLACHACNTKVPLNHLAPDIAFANVPRITHGLEIGEMVGQGGFGKVYRGKKGRGR